jgi:lipoprotein-releasing system permease protein
VQLTIFITNRLTKGNKKKFSRPIYHLAIISVSISILVMILSLSIVRGYQESITEKISGFGAHIQVSNFDLNNSYESVPINISNELIENILNIENVKQVQTFSTKAGILKKDDQIEGIVLKGINQKYDLNYLKNNLVRGEVPIYNDSTTSNKAIISEITANRLHIDTSDKVQVYFIQDPPRVRVFEISGIFNTGMGDFDKKFLIVDNPHIQRLNNWEEEQFSGIEVVLNNFDQLDESLSEINSIIPYNQKAQSIKQIFPDLFDWIKLFDVNVLVLITIISIICIITLITTILIFILEQTSFIGLMKAIGGTNRLINKIFISLTIKILAWGILWGNSLAIFLILIQKNFKIFKLDPKNYYIDHIPVIFNPLHFVAIDLISILVIGMIVLLPIYIVTRKTTTIKAIRYK